jgi:transmembrane sensor
MSFPTQDEGVTPFEEQAAKWCCLLAEDALDLSEQREFDAWICADPRHEEAFEKMVLVWQGADAIAEMPGFLSLRAQALTAMEEGQPDWHEPMPKRFVYMGAGFAAAVMLLAVLTGLVFIGTQSEIYTTGIGERRVVSLEDGSKLSLDAASSVEVTYSRERRALSIERGRAKFDVASDPLRPFIVTAGDKTVVAIGTAFSVELLPQQIRVFLYEGHVAVLDEAEATDLADASKLLADGSLSDRVFMPGQELILSTKARTATIAPGDVERSLSWEGGRLSFIDEPLSLAIERVNRTSDTPIVLGDAAAGRLIINGEFDAGDTAAFVSGVASLYPVRVSADEKKIVISSAKLKLPEK